MSPNEPFPLTRILRVLPAPILALVARARVTHMGDEMVMVTRPCMPEVVLMRGDWT